MHFVRIYVKENVVRINTVLIVIVLISRRSIVHCVLISILNMVHPLHYTQYRCILLSLTIQSCCWCVVILRRNNLQQQQHQLACLKPGKFKWGDANPITTHPLCTNRILRRGEKQQDTTNILLKCL